MRRILSRLWLSSFFGSRLIYVKNMLAFIMINFRGSVWIMATNVVWPKPIVLEAANGPMQLKSGDVTDNWTIIKGPVRGTVR